MGLGHDDAGFFVFFLVLVFVCQIPAVSLIRAKGPEHAKTLSIRIMCLRKDRVGSKYPDNALKGRANEADEALGSCP